MNAWQKKKKKPAVCDVEEQQRQICFDKVIQKALMSDQNMNFSLERILTPQTLTVALRAV